MENIFVIAGLALFVMAAALVIAYVVYTFVRMPKEAQLEKVQEWLLIAVAKAESELGGGTGRLKLRYVYDMFIVRFPKLAAVISFEAFSMMVDTALEKFEVMLKENQKVKDLVDEGGIL